jgi:small subunit ribosomal protein S20
MPVTKTAKRALRSSQKKRAVNSKIRARLEASIRKAKKEKTPTSVKHAISVVDKAAKKKVIHKNKAARIKGTLSKLGSNPFKKSAPKSSKKTTKKAKKK